MQMSTSYPLSHLHQLAEVIIKYRDKIRQLEPEIKEILKQEEEEKQVGVYVWVCVGGVGVGVVGVWVCVLGQWVVGGWVGMWCVCI